MPKVELSLATRVAWFEQATRATANGVQSDDFVGRKSEVSVSPKIELSYAPSARAFYYLNAARGYRSSGFNTGAATIFLSGGQPAREYPRDDLWSYELGAKNAFFGSHVRLRASLFWQFWRNIQTDQLFAAGVPFTGNVGDGESRGIELESTAHVTPALEVRLNASYTDSQVTRANAEFPARLKAGLPGAPRVSAGISVLYEKPIAHNLDLLASSRTMYVGASNIAFMRDRALEIGDYAVTDLRLGLQRNAWRASLYVNNVANAWSSTYSYGNPIRFGGAGMITPLSPRLFGLELQTAF
jgi:outer membrane receptor protein involved in Fe transport